MALAAVRFKAVVLLLLVYHLMYFPLFVGVLCLSLFCYALLCVHFSFAIILKAGYFVIIVLQMYCYYKSSVDLPHGAVGCLQYVIVVFPDHTHLLFDSSNELSADRWLLIIVII